MKTLFLQGPSVTLRTLILIIVCVVLMSVDHRFNHLQFLRNGLSYILYPLQVVIDLPIRIFYWTDENLKLHETLLDENQELKDLQLASRVQLQKLDILEKENARLRTLLSATPKLGERTLIAEIMRVDVDPFRQLLIINKGKNENAYINQPLVDAHGVFGQLVYTNAFTSTAMLITDASHAIPVQVDRTGLRTLAFGTGNTEYLDLPHIPHSADIKEGDKLITSGLGGRFPANFPVAIITRIERTTGEAFASVRAEPLAQLDTSREVLLVWHNQPSSVDDTAEGADDAQ